MLAVDDDLLVLENTAAMLEDLGHRVVEARSGEEALALLRRTPDVDLVITDHAMPGMTGMQLAERIAVERPGLPVILASGYGEVSAETHRILPRLSKPFDQDTLALAVADALPAIEDAGKVVALRSR